MDEIQNLLNSRKDPLHTQTRKKENEGGCGVIGLACEKKIAGKHLLAPLCQMNNRGNGKGGGVAAVGMCAKALGTSSKILETDYLLAIAYLDPKVQNAVENSFIQPILDVDHVHCLKRKDGVPQVLLYFVKVKPSQVDALRDQHGLLSSSQESLEDEIIYQNSYQLNRAFYAASGEKKAFVLSHGKNLLVLKCVGYAQEVIEGYYLEEFQAHVWIGHHRYPTKGRVWHPGGAHPFIGLHEALVHNGDFANYFSLCEYLEQRKISPLFLTDTEVAALLFDLLLRTYRYPLEYVMEAMAPTRELDFYLLPKEKQIIYDLIQKTHLNASPDGPWFFLIAQSLLRTHRLIGITDTSMLRPQVFALQTGKYPIGVIASEKQAIDALLLSVSQEDECFWPQADLYWRSRGGSYTDGGAFTFTLQPNDLGKMVLSCADKFGHPLRLPSTDANLLPPWAKGPTSHIQLPDLSPQEMENWISLHLPTWSYAQATSFLNALEKSALSKEGLERALSLLTILIDHPMKHSLRPSFWRSLVQQSLDNLIAQEHQKPQTEHQAILDARQFSCEGDHSLAREIVKRYQEGVRKFIIGHCKGHRFIGNGLASGSEGVEIDVYGSSGDYLGSGIDGAIIRVHNHGQDQLGQIMKGGKLIIYGDVGQALMYGAKGGITFVQGSVAGRALINGVGSAKLIINGTALDYLAESFMAADPLFAGGFVLLNAIAFNEVGDLVEIDPPYPGGNLFSLASGGAVYLRDPERRMGQERLNGAQWADLSEKDVDLLTPYLQENERLFRIPLSRLLENKGKKLTFQEAYRKLVPTPPQFLDPEAAWTQGSKAKI